MVLPYTICYISKSNDALTDKEIKHILEHALVENNRCEVSGVLLHSLGSFFQVLEGNKDHILALYQKILEDDRHHDIFEVYNKPSAKPVFMDYESSFHLVTSNEKLDQIREYLNKHKTQSTTEKLTRLLKPFIFFD